MSGTIKWNISGSFTKLCGTQHVLVFWVAWKGPWFCFLKTYRKLQKYTELERTVALTPKWAWHMSNNCHSHPCILKQTSDLDCCSIYAHLLNLKTMMATSWSYQKNLNSFISNHPVCGQTSNSHKCLIFLDLNQDPNIVHTLRLVNISQVLTYHKYSFLFNLLLLLCFFKGWE